jgi:hypothetical protein
VKNFLKFVVNLDLSSKGTCVDRLECSEIQHLGETKCAEEKTPEVPKSGVNSDCSSKWTHVGKLDCSGIQHLGETKCAAVKNSKVSKSGVNPSRSSKGDTCQKIIWFRSSVFGRIGLY